MSLFTGGIHAQAHAHIWDSFWLTEQNFTFQFHSKHIYNIQTYIHADILKDRHNFKNHLGTVKMIVWNKTPHSVSRHRKHFNMFPEPNRMSRRTELARKNAPEQKIASFGAIVVFISQVWVTCVRDECTKVLHNTVFLRKIRKCTFFLCA